MSLLKEAPTVYIRDRVQAAIKRNPPRNNSLIESMANHVTNCILFLLDPQMQFNIDEMRTQLKEIEDLRTGGMEFEEPMSALLGFSRELIARYEIQIAQ